MAQHREYMKRTREALMREGNYSMSYRNYYEVLGVERDATHSRIRNAYLALAMKHHPDKRDNARERHRGIADKEWATIPTAYGVLSDKESRASYDAEMPVRDALVEFSRAHNPTKLSHATVETSVQNWKGKEVELFAALKDKYEVRAYTALAPASPRSQHPHPRGRTRRAGSLWQRCSACFCCCCAGAGGVGTRLGGAGGHYGEIHADEDDGEDEDEDEDEDEGESDGLEMPTVRRGEPVLPLCIGRGRMSKVAASATDTPYSPAAEDGLLDRAMDEDDWALRDSDDDAIDVDMDDAGACDDDSSG